MTDFQVKVWNREKKNNQTFKRRLIQINQRDFEPETFIWSEEIWILVLSCFFCEEMSPWSAAPWAKACRPSSRIWTASKTGKTWIGAKELFDSQSIRTLKLYWQLVLVGLLDKVIGTNQTLGLVGLGLQVSPIHTREWIDRSHTVVLSGDCGTVLGIANTKRSSKIAKSKACKIR